MENSVSRYYSLNQYLKETFGCKVYKLALDGGMTCPNRDGILGDRGCIFCSAGGSGEFAQTFLTEDPSCAFWEKIHLLPTAYGQDTRSHQSFPRYGTK